MKIESSVVVVMAVVSLSLMGCGADKQGDAYGGSTDDTGANSDVDADGDGWTVSGGDCDDSDAGINPNADDTPCDGIDQDCDGADLTDEDGDGYECEAVGGEDCDDTNAAFHPGADDVCGDFVDYDCDGDPECDCDGDGHDGEQCDGDDCDDANAAAYPGADDVCHDGVDTDCVGNDDDDCDRDGYVDVDYGGDDCDDDDYTINPGELEVCGDDIDNDCDAGTSDCDCDLDGHDGEECGGDDCDDEDASVYPGATEAYADNLDNDCDGDIDEDAYCNQYYPLSNGATAQWSFDTMLEGTAYTESMNISVWDASTGEATLVRALSDGSSTIEIDLDVSCDNGEVSTLGWVLAQGGAAVSDVTLTAARVDLPPESELVVGTTWTAGYDGRDAMGMMSYTVEADFEVMGDEEITVAAGTFDTVKIQADYVIVDTGLGMSSREGTATWWYAPRLGLVSSMDVTTAGELYDSRELTGYSGFYP